jgi:hypothetical protein
MRIQKGHARHLPVQTTCINGLIRLLTELWTDAVVLIFLFLSVSLGQLQPRNVVQPKRQRLLYETHLELPSSALVVE